MSFLNTVVNNFLNLVRSSSSAPWLRSILQLFALSQSIVPGGWPASYQLQDGDRFDYIVVGAGSAGAIVAARLAEVPHWRVLLIEAGGDPPLASEVPSLFSLLARTQYDWSYKAELDPGIGSVHSDRKQLLILGKMLGGSSSNNYEIYSRGVPIDYEKWAEIAPGWDWKSVLHYFKKSEGMTDSSVTNQPRNSYLHSTDGPVRVSRPVSNDCFTKMSDIVLNSYEEMGMNRILEINGPDSLGVSRPHFTLADGRRYSTAEAFLRNVRDKPNLFIAKEARVTKILIDHNKLQAYGVRVSTNNGKILDVYVDKEVVVSAGTVESPKLLMLSGIGPRLELTKIEIDVIVDLPVGKNLHDHSFIPIAYTGNGVQTALQNLHVLEELDAYPIASQCGTFKLNSTIKNDDLYPRPQFQIFNIHFGAGASPGIYYFCRNVVNFDERFCASFARANIFNEMDYTLLILLHPKSRGSIKLRSKNFMDDPLIEMGYYRNVNDLFAAARGLKYMTGFVNTSYYKSIGGKIAKLDVTGCENHVWGSDDYWLCYARNTLGSMNHPVGTCAMGYKGVVDERLRVHGVQGLRVADASVMPYIPSGNTNAPTMMIGEKAADMIKFDNLENEVNTVSY